MAYRICPDESVRDGLARVVRKELMCAVDALEGHGRLSAAETVHEARKSVKKARAVLRLLHPSLEGHYARDDRQLQRVGRALSAVRDAEVLVDTFDRLSSRYPAQLPQTEIDTLGLKLKQSRNMAARAGRRGWQIDAQALADARRHAKRWYVDGHGFWALESGLRQGYRRARNAMEKVQLGATDEMIHRWRKRVKTHWYHMRLLEGRQAGAMKAYAEKIHRLETLLGEDHNLALLKQASAPELSVRLLAVIERAQSVLRRRALGIGRIAFASKPGEFTRRLRKAWQAQRRGIAVAAQAPGAVAA